MYANDLPNKWTALTVTLFAEGTCGLRSHKKEHKVMHQQKLCEVATLLKKLTLNADETELCHKLDFLSGEKLIQAIGVTKNLGLLINKI